MEQVSHTAPRAHRQSAGAHLGNATGPRLCRPRPTAALGAGPRLSQPQRVRGREPQGKRDVHLGCSG